ncbi:hypothetical protein WMF11_05505 [Sorangium sp. So ce295]|jgi:hypothetical protein|uniref:hypothetical protein n=1 Tax=Sorangium sp. So ce295 TaxID=3133295 RepID=UPI003F5FDD8F
MAIWTAFGWDAIDCFLRPQAHLLELAAPGTGDPFLLLLSLHRAHGIGDHFSSEDCGHFSFVGEVAGPALNVDFLIEPCRGPDQVREAVERAVAAGEPVLVPAARRVRGGEASSVGQGEAVHYHLVLREEQQDLVFLDSADAAPYEERTTYQEFRFPKVELGALLERFSLAGAGDVRSMLREPGLWAMRVRARPSPAGAHATSLLRMINGSSLQPGASVDRRHLRRLQAARGRGRDVTQRLLRSYLKEVNLGNLHLLMLAQHLVQERAPESARVAREVDEFIARTKGRRESMMVEILVRPQGVDWAAMDAGFEAEWRQMLDVLASTAGAF